MKFEPKIIAADSLNKIIKKALDQPVPEDSIKTEIFLSLDSVIAIIDIVDLFTLKFLDTGAKKISDCVKKKID